MSLYQQNITTPYNYNGVIVTPIYGIAINFFANRTPLTSRLPVAPLGAMSFKTTSDNFRPNSQLVNDSDGLDDSQTDMDVTDATMYMAGDIVEIGTEVILITAISSNTCTIVRGFGGSTAASHAQSAVIYLIGNCRTGAETEQLGVSRIPATALQYAQTFQHPYQVGGALASATDYALPPGVASFVGRERMYAMQNCSDDIERACYYGVGVADAATTTRQAMVGLRSLCVTNQNLNPTNKGSYKPSDLIRDTLAVCYAGGGNPDTLIVSTDFMAGLSIWGHAIQRIPAGETLFGTPIDAFAAPFIAGATIIPAPLLRAGTVICLSSGEVRMRVKRAMFDKPRGSRGDADEGDILAEQAIELDNEAHHAFVSGITALTYTAAGLTNGFGFRYLSGMFIARPISATARHSCRHPCSQASCARASIACGRRPTMRRGRQRRRYCVR